MYVLRFSTCSRYRSVNDDGNTEDDNWDNDNNNKDKDPDNEDVEHLALNIKIYLVLRRNCRCSGITEAYGVNMYGNADDEENGSSINIVSGLIALGHNNNDGDKDDDNNNVDYPESNCRGNVGSLSEFYRTLTRCCDHCLDILIIRHNYYNDGKNVLFADMMRVSSVLATAKVRGFFYSAESDDSENDDGLYTSSDASSIVAISTATANGSRSACKKHVGARALFRALALNLERVFGGSGGDDSKYKDDINYRCNRCKTDCITDYCRASSSAGSNSNNSSQYRLIRVTAGEYLLEVRSDSEYNDKDNRDTCTLHRVQNQLMDACRDTLLQTAPVCSDEVRYKLRFESIVLPNEKLHIDDHYSFYTQLREATI